MVEKSVQCEMPMPNAENAWSYIRDFGSTWHPDIVSNKIKNDVSGALIREFEGADGGTYCEQRTYFSDTDQTLRYAMISGIKGVENYRGEATVRTGKVSWSASFDAPPKIADAVALGTTSVFENGLNWLAKNCTEPLQSKSEKTATASIPLQRIPIEGAPQLSVLTPKQDEEPCWALILFLHGIGGNATNWTDQLHAFGNDHPVAALDFRGYGESTLGDEQSTIDDLCNDILRVMKHFGARKLVLVGLSMGSWIATSFAMRHPHLLTGLVLAGGCTGMSEADAEQRNNFQASRSVPLSEGKTPADFADGVVEIIAGPNASQRQREALHASMAAIPSDTYLDALTYFCNPVERFDFSRITCPVLLMTGEHDRLAPPQEIRQVSLRMFDDIQATGALPDIQFEVIEYAGHLCNLEQPQRFNNHLADFLGRMPNTKRSKTPDREAKRQMKSRRILDAALAEFSANGYDGISMTQIADRASVSKPTLYQYFGDKDGLFAAVLQEGCDLIITPLSAPAGSLVERLWNFSWTYADFVLRPDMLSLARLVLGEASRRPDVAQKYHEAGPGKAFKGLVTFIEECAQAGQLDVDDLEYAAQDLWSLILSGPRDHYLHFVNEAPDTAQLLRSIEHGLRIFLKIYSSNKEADLTALDAKVKTFKQTTTNHRGSSTCQKKQIKSAFSP